LIPAICGEKPLIIFHDEWLWKLLKKYPFLSLVLPIIS